MCIPAILPSRRARTTSASTGPTSRRWWTAAGIPQTSAAGILSGRDVLLVFSVVRNSTSRLCRSRIKNRDPLSFKRFEHFALRKHGGPGTPGHPPPDHSWSSEGPAIFENGLSEPQQCCSAFETRLRFSDFLPAVCWIGRQTGARRPDPAPPARSGHQARHPVAR